MQRPNLRGKRPHVPNMRPLGRRGELYISEAKVDAECALPLCRKHIHAGAPVKRRTGCVQVTCIDCDFPKELGNYV